jgi:MEMO1 family protein
MTDEPQPDEPLSDELKSPTCPKLRTVDVSPVELDGQSLVALRDPSWARDRSVLLSHSAVALVSLFDGKRDRLSLVTDFAERYGEALAVEVVDSLVAQLDEALVLDSPRYHADLRERREDFSAQAHRPMTMGGTCFAATAQEARVELDGFYSLDDGPGRLPEGKLASGADGVVQGVIAPHIDYERGAALYGQAYLKVAEGAADAELYVLLGTDHKGEVDAPFSLTTLDFETPFGILRTDADLVRSLCAEAPDLCAGELAHAQEHSLEFQAVMLHHALGHRSDLRILPVLCGLLTDREGLVVAERQARIEAFIESLREIRRDRKTCFIAGADLAHLGPAFGTGPLTPEDHRALERRDAETLDLLCRADTEGFRRDVEADGNGRNICGLSAMYTLLRVLEPESGTLLGYRQCQVPGETDHGSRVSIATICYP